MIKYLLAIKIRSLAPNMRVSNFLLHQYAIDYPFIKPRDDDRTLVLPNPLIVDIPAIIDAVENSGFTRIDCHCYGQRMEYFPDLDTCRRAFPDLLHKGHYFDDSCVVCPIRGAEVLKCVHEDYVQLPIGFYEDIVTTFELRPVFVGQLDDNMYVRELRKRFPRALFLQSGDPDVDFQTIRNARNVVVPVSTFAWLSSWLSSAGRIFLPVAGLFNPEQAPLHCLIPHQDIRYLLYKFPVYKATSEDRLIKSLSKIEGTWSRLPSPATYTSSGRC